MCADMKPTLGQWLKLRVEDTPCKTLLVTDTSLKSAGDAQTRGVRFGPSSHLCGVCYSLGAQLRLETDFPVNMVHPVL